MVLTQGLLLERQYGWGLYTSSCNLRASPCGSSLVTSWWPHGLHMAHLVAQDSNIRLLTDKAEVSLYFLT